MKSCYYIFIFYFFIFSGFSQSKIKRDELTLKADSLHDNGDYKLAFELRKQAVSNYSSSNKSYNSFLNAKLHLTESCLYEKMAYNYHNPNDSISKRAYDNYFKLAIEKSKLAKSEYEKVAHPDKLFKYNIQSRIYHQFGYTGKWKLALVEAELGLQILKDTLTKNDKKFVDLIHDIGYIYAELGDYSKAIENYKISQDMYINNIGEKTTDVALSYNNIAVQYKKMGLRKEELFNLLKAKDIWEQLNNDEDMAHLYICYSNLFKWYSYYGDYEKAEEYLLKQNKIKEKIKVKPQISFMNNQEEKYKYRLKEWQNLMLHYGRKKDTIKLLYYAKAINDNIKPSKKLLNFEIKTISQTLKYEASIYKVKNPSLALAKIDQAIQFQEAYKDQFFTKVFPYKLYKAELLVDSKRFEEAQLFLKDLALSKTQATLAENFKLTILKAKTAAALKDTKTAEMLFNTAFGLLAKSSKSNIENLTVDDLKPLISFETTEGFIAMGDFYMKLFTIDKQKSHQKKALHRYMIASKIYNQLYLGERYNELLFQTNNEINERLMSCLAANKNTDLTEVVNSMENNASKLIWSKFNFNNKRLKIKIPEAQLNEEERLISELNFYQNKILESNQEEEDKIMLWKGKIYDLKNELSKIQALIQKQHPNYYQFNLKEFDLKLLQNDLKKNEAILKYSITNKNVYAFLISKNKVELIALNDKKTIQNQVNECLSFLKDRKPNYQKSFIKLHSLLLDQINYQAFDKLTIIPDGSLHYLPFEVLLLDKKVPLISYASSLLLYQEQRAIKPSYSTVSIGAFSASNEYAKLPQTASEIDAILSVFNGKAYVNAGKIDFLKQANLYNVLHLAMHSDSNEEYPEFSSLHFYGKTNSKLFISELYNETLVANLAVLSACDTGNGFYENGEGVISLSRAFNYAGIPSTVMSLWRVDDEATAKMMRYFYKHLSQGETKDEALKNAKLAYLENTTDPLLKHPYYWSGFVISGNTDALVKNDFDYKWILLLVIVFSIILIFYRKKLVQLFK